MRDVLTCPNCGRTDSSCCYVRRAICCNCFKKLKKPGASCCSEDED